MKRISRAAEALGVPTARQFRGTLAKILAFVLAFVSIGLAPGLASAATLNTASVALSDPTPSQTGVSYTFTGSGVTTSTPIKCITVQFTTTAGGSTLPGSMGITATSLDASSNFVPTPSGFGSASNPNGYTVQFTDSSGETPASSSARTLELDGITNGSTGNVGYYETVSTFSDTGCSTPIDNAMVQFIYNQGSTLSLTVNNTLSFSVNAVAASQGCDGTTTTQASTATTIPFGTVTAAANGVVCQDLTAASNATNGYTIYTRYTAPPTNALNQTILPWTGTNTTPTTFSAPGTEAYGYSTNDATLGTGTANRFDNSGNFYWAAETTSNAEVAYEPNGVTSTTYRIGHQVGISLTTHPGTYTTTVIYTCTPIY